MIVIKVRTADLMGNAAVKVVLLPAFQVFPGLPGDRGHADRLSRAHRAASSLRARMAAWYCCQPISPHTDSMTARVAVASQSRSKLHRSQ
jgi:hypothetical protein